MVIYGIVANAMNFNDLPSDIKYLIFKSKPFKKERKKIRREIKENKRIYDSVIWIMNDYMGFGGGERRCRI
jgi:hypothetical protein